MRDTCWCSSLLPLPLPIKYAQTKGQTTCRSPTFNSELCALRTPVLLFCWQELVRVDLWRRTATTGPKCQVSKIAETHTHTQEEAQDTGTRDASLVTTFSLCVATQKRF